jgi:2,5-diketo-D-gluconate reductase A
VFVTTKLPPDHADRERRTLAESLTKLGLDFVDLWLGHWPPGGQAAPKMWEQFIAAQQDGLAKAIGVSNYALDQIDELTAATGVIPSVDQIRWSPALYDRGVASGLEQRGVVLEGYSPFKRSNLDDPTLVSIAGEHEATTAQVIVAWHVGARLRRHPEIGAAGTDRGQRCRGTYRADSRRGDGHRQLSGVAMD